MEIPCRGHSRYMYKLMGQQMLSQSHFSAVLCASQSLEVPLCLICSVKNEILCLLLKPCKGKGSSCLHIKFWIYHFSPLTSYCKYMAGKKLLEKIFRVFPCNLKGMNGSNFNGKLWEPMKSSTAEYQKTTANAFGSFTSIIFQIKN